MIGARATPVGTPASDRTRSVSKRIDGAAPSGSMRRPVSSSANGMLT